MQESMKKLALEVISEEAESPNLARNSPFKFIENEMQLEKKLKSVPQTNDLIDSSRIPVLQKGSLTRESSRCDEFNV